MILRDAINRVLDEIVTTSIEDAVGTDQHRDYKLIMPIRSRIMTLVRAGISVAIMKTVYIGASKHSFQNVQRICNELTSVYNLFADNHPSIGLLVAGSLSPSAREYLNKAGIRHVLIDFITIQAVFAGIGVDISSLNERINCSADQLDQVTERLLDANRLSLSTYITSLLNRSGITAGITPLMPPEDVQAMAESTKTLSAAHLDFIVEAAGIDTLTAKSELTDHLKDTLDAAYRAGYRQGRTSTIPMNPYA